MEESHLIPLRLLKKIKCPRCGHLIHIHETNKPYYYLTHLNLTCLKCQILKKKYLKNIYK